MSGERDSTLDDSIRIAGVLPYRWQVRDTALSDTERDTLNAANLSVLEAIAVVEEKPVSDEHAPLHQEIRRLDAKTDLLISMVGRLLRAQSDLPLPAELVLTSRGAELPAGSAKAGDSGVFLVYPSAAIPEGLRFAAVATAPDRLEFSALPDLLQSAYDRLLFRQHRRDIAQRKSSTPPQ